MKHFVSLRDYAVLTTDGRKSTATFWLLLHQKAGVVMLNASSKLKVNGRRIVALMNADNRLAPNCFAGDHFSITSTRELLASAFLPDDAPKHGPRLLKVALDTLCAQHEPTPLILKKNRNEAELRAIMQAMATLSGEPQNLRCWTEPEWTPALDGRAADAVGDHFSWFEPRSWNNRGRARSHWQNIDDHAVFIRATPTSDPTAHDRLNAANLLIRFYATAAAPLGLSRETVAARLGRFGIEMPGNS